MPRDPLLEAAKMARERAFAKYSGFRVGAALETADGRIVSGCNVESASYGLTMCAERVAVCNAISQGEAPRSFRRIAVCAQAESLTPPCGACRQILWEFCGDVPVLLSDPDGRVRELRLGDLLPEAFDDSSLH